MIICLIGTGLIGCSMALTLKEASFASKVIGVDKSSDHLNKAISLSYVDEAASLEDGIKQSDAIVLATPVNIIAELLPNILDLIEDQWVIDVGSTKSILIDKVSNHEKRGHYIASHPMAGTEFSGPEAAIPDLFKNKVVVLCNTQDNPKLFLDQAVSLFEHLQMEILYQDAIEHDVHAAYVSHISHISSFALALTVLEKEKNEDEIFKLASGGFDSTVRLAKSSPAMWVPIFEQNRDNVLDVLDEHINTLARFRSLLIKKDFVAFYKAIEKANEIKRILQAK